MECVASTTREQRIWHDSHSGENQAGTATNKLQTGRARCLRNYTRGQGDCLWVGSRCVPIDMLHNARHLECTDDGREQSVDDM